MELDLQIDDIKLDEENPRDINQETKNKLSNSIKEFNNISGIVFNKRTKTLVSGHQRLSILKELYPTLKTEKINDNLLNLVFQNESGAILQTGFNIKIVDWPIEKQKAANIIANDERISGDWNKEKLSNIFEQYDLGEFEPIFEISDLVMSINVNDDINLLTKNNENNTDNVDHKDIHTIIIKCTKNEIESLLIELNTLNKEKFNNNIFIKKQ